LEKTRFLVEYDVGVEEKLRNIPKTMRNRIREAIEKRLMVAPLDFGKPLIREWRGYRRLRVGDYRVICRVFEDKVVVFNVEIDHRKDVYES
jgi:mRNA interferase RelE/StbE